jgi:alpha/beta superfamily hydrolase
MQKLIIATIGLSLGMSIATAAIAQSAQTAGQMQTAPATNSDNTTVAPAASAPSPQATAPETMSPPPAPPASHSYPRCSATIRDECRQRN